MIAATPMFLAEVATLTAKHLRLLSSVDRVAHELEAGKPVSDAVAELRGMAEDARAAA